MQRTRAAHLELCNEVCLLLVLGIAELDLGQACDSVCARAHVHALVHATVIVCALQVAFASLPIWQSRTWDYVRWRKPWEGPAGRTQTREQAVPTSKAHEHQAHKVWPPATTHPLVKPACAAAW